jgi:nucleoside-diphosphate-sugar epimerase
MKVLVTGGAGFTGTEIVRILSAHHQVRSMDIHPHGHQVHDVIVGDVSDLNTCASAVAGVDAVVMCHMAKNPDGYRTPERAIDINVKGTANLYHSMAGHGARRAVLISSTGVLRDPPAPVASVGEGPYSLGSKKGMYGLTKVLQEMTARHFFEAEAIVTTILRPGWIVRDESLLTKYGGKVEHYESHLIDPRDIGTAVLAALSLSEPTLEAFHLVQTDSNYHQPDQCLRLGWQPAHHFDELRV